jgi:hypothetical protein
MSDRLQDTDLRARFRAQRRADAQGAPSFAALLGRARAADTAAPQAPGARRLTLRRVLYVSGLAAAAVIGTLLVIPGPRSTEDAFEQAVRAFHADPALGAWRSPTDGLLDVPGSQLISTVPSVGAQ